jgi:guanine deaminase
VSDSAEKFMRAAFDAAKQGMADGRGGPFGAVVVRGEAVIAAGSNRVVRDQDPTAHAEVMAIREACRRLGTHTLAGCEIYCTTEPCPMCLAAIYWARIDKVWFSATRMEAARVGFDDALIYKEVSLDIGERRIPMIHLDMAESRTLFEAWTALPTKVPY